MKKQINLASFDDVLGFKRLDFPTGNWIFNLCVSVEPELRSSKILIMNSNLSFLY